MFNLISLITTVGYLGIFAIIFAESGLLVGFFFPGDSLIFTAGFLASQNILSLPILLPLVIVAAILGDGFGYYCGQKFGPKIFIREDSFFFKKSHIAKANLFFTKHGGKAIILARFMPVVRTFVPVVAGVGTMRYKKFAAYNIIGGLLWSCGLILAGYFLGRSVPNIDHYLLPIIFLIIILSLLPSIFHVIRDDESRAQIIIIAKKMGNKVRRRKPSLR